MIRARIEDSIAVGTNPASAFVTDEEVPMETDRLSILWTNAYIPTAEKVVMMYTTNGMIHR